MEYTVVVAPCFLSSKVVYHTMKAFAQNSRIQQFCMCSFLVLYQLLNWNDKFFHMIGALRAWQLSVRVAFSAVDDAQTHTTTG
jgi:hypothetical protein